MNVRLRIILFSLLTISLLASSTVEKSNDKSSRSFHNPTCSDTILANNRVKIDPFDLNILPPSTGVQFYKDGIIFLSSAKFHDRMINNHISFGTLDAYYSVLKDSIFEESRLFSPGISFPYPCEAITFTGDFNTMYFTRYSKNDGVEKIFKAEFSASGGTNGEWSIDENPLSFCSGKATFIHPALSADGKIMIFASDQSGSMGGMDLFVTQYKGGTWSTPVNLGDAVNTRANELYPYLDSENNLFFSSDGIQGFGGYDIFVCKFKSNTWEKPINLSDPINTRFDDIAFRGSRSDGKSAFFTVRQNTVNKSLQLYKATLKNFQGQENFSTLAQFFTSPSTPHMVILVTEPAVQATDRRTETVKTKISEGDKDVVYRVQFLTSFNPRSRSKITMGGKDYGIFEYLYDGAYRLCVGEFNNLAQALELQKIMNQNDYPQAIVVVFKNNIRSLDPDLLKVQPPSISPGAAEKPKSELLSKEKSGEQKIDTIIKKTTVANAQVSREEPKSVAIAKEIPKTQVTKAETAVKTETPGSAEKKDIIVYRVQILSSNSAKGSYKITINNKVYNTFEYPYNGVYRTCVGDFSSLGPAKELQNTCRNSGHPQAFVVAFKNNIRTTDPSLFK
jgi:hypothetical protein